MTQPNFRDGNVMSGCNEDGPRRTSGRYEVHTLDKHSFNFRYKNFGSRI